MSQIFLVKILIRYTNHEEKHLFDTLVEANDFLIKQSFVFDDYDEEGSIHYWSEGQFTYATIEESEIKCQETE